MISVSNFAKNADVLPPLDDLKSVQDLQGRMVEDGNEWSKSLFVAAKLLLDETSEFPGLERTQQTAVLKSFLANMLRREIVIAVDTDESPDVKAAAVYTTGIQDLIKQRNVARLDRLATVPSKQRKSGYGSAVLGHIENEVKSQGMDSLWVSASLDAATFYLRKGYRMSGDLVISNQTLMLFKDVNIEDGETGPTFESV